MQWEGGIKAISCSNGPCLEPRKGGGERRRKEGDVEEAATGGRDLSPFISLVDNPIICFTFGISV